VTPASARAPSVPAVIFVLLAILVPLGLQQPMLNADGDPARHLTHGLYMIAHRSLIHHDPFSFTRPGAPFLGFEYGSQLAYALAYRVGGLPAVAILAGLLIATAYAMLAAFLLRRGVDPLLAYATTACAAALGAGHWVARPHLFSLVAVVVLLGILERPTRIPLWIIGAMFAVWANFHGGFVFGWILIGAYVAGTAGEWLLNRQSSTGERVRYLTFALAIAVFATVLNPHGPALLEHVTEFLGKRFIQNNTQEFLSPNFHEIDGRIFLCGIALLVLTLAMVRERPTLPRLCAILVTLAFGLMSVRNVSLFGMIALPLLALHADAAWRALPDPRSLRTNFGAMASRASTWPFVLPAALAMALLALAHGRVGGHAVMAQDFDPATFPVAAVEKARAEKLQGRMFNEFAWGGYLIFAWPEQRIFIDGGTDFFGEDLFEEYSKVKLLQPGWRDVLDRWNISLAMLRRRSALAHELVRNPEWSPLYCDSLTALLRRQPGATPYSATQGDSAEHALDGCAGPSGARGDADQGYAPRKPDAAERTGLEPEDAGEGPVEPVRYVADIGADGRASEPPRKSGDDDAGK